MDDFDMFDIPNSGMTSDEYDERAMQDSWVDHNTFHVDDDVMVGETHWTVVEVRGGSCYLQHQSRKHIFKWLHWTRLVLEYRKPFDSGEW